VHEPGILGMAIGAILYRIGFWQNLMRNKNRVIDRSVALDAPYFREVGCLVGQPVVAFNNHNLFPVGLHGESIVIGMTAQAHVVVKQDGLVKVIGIPHERFLQQG